MVTIRTDQVGARELASVAHLARHQFQTLADESPLVGSSPTARTNPGHERARVLARLSGVRTVGSNPTCPAKMVFTVGLSSNEKIPGLHPGDASLTLARSTSGAIVQWKDSRLSIEEWAFESP